MITFDMVIIVLIICFAVIFVIYMLLAYQNQTGMFYKSDYSKQKLDELEDRIEKIENMIGE